MSTSRPTPSLPPPPRCQLAARDFAFLQELLAKSSPSRDEAFLRLLRRKLETAIVMFPADIDERVAAIGSRIGFTANAGVPKSCTRSEEHTSELQSLMRTSYAVLSLTKNTTTNTYQKNK